MRTAILLLGLSVSGGALLAQAAPNAAANVAPEAAQSAPARGALRLTAEQRQKMQELRAGARDRAEIIRHDQSLTEAQKQDKLKALRVATGEQMKAVLTPEQQQAFAARRAQGAQKAAARLNLTDDQKAKLKALRVSNREQRQAVLNNQSLTSEQKQTQLAQIRASNKTQLASILTPEQLTQLRQMRHSRRHQQL
ncbi:MAG: hypothetical protein P4M01_05565 [Acidobacteriota bacterium]|nr:hypothetical protein [Acidobacteriota bacterium]